MNLLSSIYGVVTAARNRLYDSGRLPVRHLQAPVVSVGNLSVGGAGKTPFVILLGEQLKRRGLPFDILSRGYGRESRGVRRVETDGTSREFGDEPLLLARRLGVPVWVGESRLAAGLAAEKKSGPNLHLLDDGFQHRALARDFDIVLLSESDAGDRLLPAGRLREPLASLQRANAVVLTNAVNSPVLPVQKPIWRVTRGLRLENPPSRPIVFCAIARPQNFFSQVRTAGIEPAAEISYHDHHAYSESDIANLLALRRQHSANGFLTTEKDAINLGAHLTRLQPLSIAQVTMEFADPMDAVDTMLRIVDERSRRS